MPDKHLSTQFDSEMNAVSSKVMELGGRVEAQIRQAIFSLANWRSDVAEQVIEEESLVDRFEIEIDRDISSIIGRRQPTARDLRLLMAMSKITASLGFEAKAWAATPALHSTHPAKPITFRKIFNTNSHSIGLTSPDYHVGNDNPPPRGGTAGPPCPNP